MRGAIVVGCLAACGFEHGDLPKADARRDDAPGDQANPDSSVSVIIEAETPMMARSSDGIHAWAVETALTGFSGSGYITALPNDFNNCIDVSSMVCGAYNTYAFTVPVAGMYRVTVHHFSASGGDDSVHWYVGGAAVSEDFDPDINTMWTDDTSTRSVPLPAGGALFGLRMRETGANIDFIRLDLE